MHKEEFFNTLIGDEFISALIAQVKTIFKHIKIEEINLLIAKIEEGIWTPNKEMTKFSDFLIDQLKSFIESDFLDDEDENLNLNNSNMSEVGISSAENGVKQVNNAQICIEKIEDNMGKSEKNEKTDKSMIYYSSSNKKISFSMSTQIITEKPSKIGNDVGLDELLEYIAADENPKKTNKKKNKKKKNNKNTVGNNLPGVNSHNSAKNSNGSTENNVKTGNHQNGGTLPNPKEADQEVEMFRNSLKSQICCGKKIKPNLSQEWLNGILQIVKASQ